MATHIAFLRAINLGAKRKFPKDAIVEAVESAGFTGVATYINTGNVRFDTRLRSRTRIEAALEKAFEAKAGFAVPTMVFTQKELREIAAEAASLGQSLGHGGKHYVSLLKEAPTAAAIKKLEDSITTDEVARVGGRAVHLLLGSQYHEATLTNVQVEKHLGVATNRNLTVIRALAEKWG